MATIKENKKVKKLYDLVSSMESDAEDLDTGGWSIDSTDAFIDETDKRMVASEVMEMMDFARSHPEFVYVNDAEFHCFWKDEATAVSRLEKLKTKLEKLPKAKPPNES